jgi:dTDP-4-amino-4,6-dideoxygalactose transaminase
MHAPIAQTNPGAWCQAHRDEIEDAVRRVIDSGWYILGREVTAFEAEFAAFAGEAGTGGLHAVGVANGTDALVLALEAVGIGPGAAVVTVSHTAVATVAAIEMAGATPILVDVDEAHGLDPAALEAALAAPPPGTPPIRAIVPVHLYGQPVDLDAVMAIADRHGLTVVEDMAQAHGALWWDRPAGSFGVAASYSFYPTKNLGALGDGGALVTRDAAIAERARSLRQYGWRERYISDVVGRNSRLDELQAAILRAGLRHLSGWNDRRRAIAAAYDRGLAGLPVTLPVRRPGATHVFHQYVVELDDRDAVADRLRGHGVGTGVHYPVPVHLQPAYRDRTPLGTGGLARTERLAGRVLSLPMHPFLTDEEVERVIQAMAAATSG